jgi:MFS family permease
MTKGSGFQAIRSAFAIRDFRIYTTGNVGSHIGTWVQRAAVGWLTWQLTGSAFWLGAIAMADVAPAVVLAPLAGAVADRVERIHAIKLTQALAMVQAATLAVLTYTGLITIEILLGLTIALGIVMAFNQPLRLAITPSLVGRRDLAAAIGINSLSFNVSRIVGPAIAGPIIVQWGVAPCFTLNAVSYVAFIGALFMMKGAAKNRPARTKPLGNIPAEIMEGMLYCVRHAGIAPLFVTIAVTAVLGRAYSELLPGFAAEVFGHGATGFAMLLSSMGVGAVVAGALLAGRGAIEGLTRVVVRSVLVLALAVIAFTMAPNIWVGMGCIAVSGYAAVTCSVGQQTLLQSSMAPAIRGRVMSLYGMIMRGGPALGALLMGALHGVLGLRWPVFGGAMVCLVLWLWAWRRRHLMAAALEGGADPPATERAAG